MEFLSKFEYKNNGTVTGLTNELAVFYVNNYFNSNDEDVLVVFNTLFEATKFFNLMQTYTDNVYLFPADDFLTEVISVKSPELKFTRLETLKNIKSNKKSLIVTNLTGYIKKIESPNTVTNLNLKTSDEVSRNELVDMLDNFGYNKESLVTSTGEFSVRGLIIDVFPIHYDNPIRIEFDGDEIESIRYFDEANQKTFKVVDEVVINSLSENVDVTNTELNSSLLDYMNCKNVFLMEDSQISAGYIKLLEQVTDYKANNNIDPYYYHDFDELSPVFSMSINNFGNKSTFAYSSKEHINYDEDFTKLKSDYNKYISTYKSVVFCLPYDSEIRKIKEIIKDATITKTKINKGFIFEDYVVISDLDIEKKVDARAEYKGNFKFGKKIKSPNSLDIGDYVVHIQNGIGVYNGIKKITKNGIEKDFIQILYSGDDKVYIPVEKISNIYKYSDKDGTKPKLNKLQGDSWNKTRRYIESKIKDISLELINLYKKRLEVKSVKYDPYFNEEEIFDKSFEFELTNNQRKSVNDILGDLQSTHPMDRLLCGDVGFGKTEVAFRGMFNTVLNNKQVMYLCPTTILSSQQYKVALSRFKDWPIEIALLNRFVSTKDANNIIKRFSEGKIDILFGTHRILSDDIKPGRLGMLVVDEEQRFGVTHKEKIKSFKDDVNVLTLSATPIPRTLKMALSGIRDLSVLDSPPVNRYPVQTYVIDENDLIIRDAIYKELSRGGQVFILYNNVSSIESKMRSIKKLIPDANINFAHGQMDKKSLEKIMNDFINHEYDILICTTIIESGIDIPNVNTLIVYDADHFGLSQLYQIRGRVGRSNKIGYAYLLYKQSKVLNEVAVKRLKAIQDFTELGSGYKIAMRDLAIRGAGDIFGASQAGFVDSLGINLYLKMVDDEVRRQKGEEVEEDKNKNALIDVSTHISDDYVVDEDIKIEMHQLINGVYSKESFDEVYKELLDRFGMVPDSIKIYMYEEWFEKLASSLDITNVRKDERLVEVTLPVHISENIPGDKLLMDCISINTKFNIKYLSKQIVISLLYKNNTNHFLEDYIKLFECILEYINDK